MDGADSSIDLGALCEMIALAAEEALSERERLILDLRLGLSTGESQTLEQVGSRIGVTRERIRQIVEKCIRRIRAKAGAQARRRQIDGACVVLMSSLQTWLGTSEEAYLERLVELTLPLPYSLSYVVWRLLRPKSDMKLLRRLERRRSAALHTEGRRRPTGEAAARLLAMTAWPGTTRKLSSIPYTRRQREVSSEGLGHTGSFISDKLAREVVFESNIEARFLRALETSSLVASYQEQPFSIPYEYHGQDRLYFPDVFVLLSDGRGLVVEIKPYLQFGLLANLSKWSALKAFCRDQGYGLLITDGRIAMQVVQRHSVPPAYREAVQYALAAGPVSWLRYRELRDEHHPSNLDFAALVLQDELEWTLIPYRLKRRASPS